MPRTLVIVGAGFCGTVLAAHLLRRPPAEATEIVLIERGTSIGRGVAYAGHDVPYVLNVPAGRLSVDPKDPHQFLRFVRQSHPEADAEDFMPRALYGDYLQDVLDQAERAAPPHVTLTRIFGEVTNVSRAAVDKPLSANFADRAAIPADRIVLALGNPRSAVHPWARGLSNHPAYIHDPWSISKSFRAEHSVLIVGTGLTMVDVALALSLEGGRVPLVRTISRHGLLPQSQTIFRPTAVQGSGEFLLSNASSIRRVLSASRALAARSGAHGRGLARGGDLHPPSGAGTLATPAARRAATVHCGMCSPIGMCIGIDLPPRMAARIDHMRRSGRLKVYAGRIQQLVPEGDELRVMLRRRGAPRD